MFMLGLECKSLNVKLLFKAKIPAAQLKLVLEPEAASVLCKILPLERNGEDQFGPFNEGTKYLVLDLGGTFTLSFVCYVKQMCVKKKYSVSWVCFHRL